MHGIRGCDTHAYRGALAYFERRALLAEIPARGEEFGRAHFARVYLVFRRREAIIAHSRNNVLNLWCGTQRARRDFQAAASPPVKVWLSGA